jgi:alanine-glyoxylate transaminase/serine-glyoxylate transaminase/serine-pyruvate transaminase
MINIPQRIPLGPGPSPVSHRVLLAMAQPTVGHLDPVCLEVMDSVRRKLRQVFRTQNELTLAVSGTGTAGMECALVNLIEPGDKVLICTNGYFGERMVEIASRTGAEVHILDVDWGEPILQEQVLAETKRLKPKVVGIVHGETSTGIHNRIDHLGHQIHELGALLVVDCVATLGGMEVDTDGWGLDAVYSGSQKCLSCPPGLAPLTISPRALERLESRKSRVQSWYLDLTLVKHYWGEDRFYHHTAPVNMLYGLEEALTIVLEEGLDKRIARHEEMHRRLKEGLAKMGLKYASPEGYHMPVVNAIEIPNGVDDVAVRKSFLNDYNIEIGAGLGKFKGKAWRIGLMGEGATLRNVTLVCAALEEILARTRSVASGRR